MIKPMYRNSSSKKDKSEEHADGWVQVICINENMSNLVEVGYGEQVEVIEKLMSLLLKLEIIRSFDFYSVKKS